MKKSILLIAFNLTLNEGFIAQNNVIMKNINQNAPVKCSKTISIKANPEKVWLIMTDVNNWDKWQTDIGNPKLNGELKSNNSFVWKTGGAKIKSTLHTVESNKHFGWTGKTFGMYAIHNWTLKEVNGQTQVTVDESMEGFLAKLLKKSFNKNLKKGMQNRLDLLKREAEK